MTKEVIYKCRFCSVTFLKKEVKPEICPVCERPDWMLVPLTLKKNGEVIGTVEHGTNGLITFFPEKNIPWSIKNLARLIKDMTEYDNEGV